MISRSLLLLAVALAGLGMGSRQASSLGNASVETHLLGQASVSLRHRSAFQVLSWLRRQAVVQRAALGPDRRTLDIRFRDGTQGAILPATMTTTRLPGTLLRSHLRPFARQQAPGARALVLEPAATELGLGPTAGDLEVNQLRVAGFQVDQLYDTAVSVSSMALLSQYNVTYMHTHSGTSAGGDGVVATGQPANDDPSVAPLLQNGSVIKITVSGTQSVYYGITSTYIRSYEGQFPAHSLLFLNGCDMLQAPLFWQALASKGLGVLVSWDKEARSIDNYLAGAWLFAEMNQGLTVDAAIAAVKAAGYGTSPSTLGTDTETATLGYVGDGQITLQSAASSPPQSTPTPEPPSPTPAAPAPPTSTPTPLPTPTATPIPAPPLTVQLKHRVNPGDRQVITMTSKPDTILHIRVTFPSGDARTETTATDASGTARYVYPQHPNRVTYKHVFATVTVEALKDGAVARQTVLYRVGWAPVDVTVQPQEQGVGRQVTIWIHTRARTPLSLSLRFPKGSVERFTTKTGRYGWASIHYRVGRYLKNGNNHTVIVQAKAVLEGRPHLATTTFRIV